MRTQFTLSEIISQKDEFIRMLVRQIVIDQIDVFTEMQLEEYQGPIDKKQIEADILEHLRFNVNQYIDMYVSDLQNELQSDFAKRDYKCVITSMHFKGEGIESIEVDTYDDIKPG